MSCLWNLFWGTLWIEKPQSLKESLNFNGIQGGLEYSMSTFGSIPYEEEDEI